MAERRKDMNGGLSAKAKELFKRRERDGWPMLATMDSGIKIGDKITISGLRNLKTGRTITNCKPGKESVYVVTGYCDSPLT